MEFFFCLLWVLPFFWVDGICFFCANCANKMEEAAKNTAGVKDATVNFMALKMNVEFEEGADAKAVMQDVLKNCKKGEDDCESYL